MNVLLVGVKSVRGHLIQIMKCLSQPQRSSLRGLCGLQVPTPLSNEMTCERLLFCVLESFHDSNSNCPLRDNSFQVNVLLVGLGSVRRQFKLKCELKMAFTNV